MIGRNLVQPGRESTLSLEGGEMSYHLNENFLGDILGIRRIADHSYGDIIYPVLMFSDQLFQSGSVTL
jgi:hypothetical protein